MSAEREKRGSAFVGEKVVTWQQGHGVRVRHAWRPVTEMNSREKGTYQCASDEVEDWGDSRSK